MTKCIIFIAIFLALPLMATEMATVQVKVEGMTWGVSCVARVTSALKGVDGVKEVKIDFEQKVATVTGEKSKMKAENLLSALDKTGRYKGALVQATSKSTRTFLMKVGGMTWGVSCVARVTSTLKTVEGVKDVKVFFDKKLVLVRGDKNTLKAEKLLAALEKTGKYSGKMLALHKTIRLLIDGMTWGVSCVARVTSALKAVEGVKKVEVNFAEKTATVRGNRNKLKLENLLAALEKTGKYKGSLYQDTVAIQISIPGLECHEDDEAWLKEVFEPIAGVKSVHVDFNHKVVTVKGNPKLLKAESLVAVLKQNNVENVKVLTTGSAKVEPKPEPKTRTVMLKVDGMTWGKGCVARVSSALKVVPGVTGVEIDFGKKTAKVTGDGKLKDQALLEALAKTNRYKGTVITR